MKPVNNTNSKDSYQDFLDSLSPEQLEQIRRFSKKRKRMNIVANRISLSVSLCASFGLIGVSENDG